ncbi:MAG: YesL family protein [Brotaphodocola sp.]
MLSNIFNYDNPVWRFIGKFFDVMILNILWTICSLPIVTIGASTTAVYYVTLRLVRDEEGTSTWRDFFKSFKENFKQATAIWLILLVVGAVLAGDLYIFTMVMTGSGKLRIGLLSLFVGLAIIYAGIFTFVFPLQSRFYNPVKRTLFNAFFMSIRHFLNTVGILAIDIAIPFIAITMGTVLQPILFLFGFPLIAYINSFLLAPIFAKYMPKKEVSQM